MPCLFPCWHGTRASSDRSLIRAVASRRRPRLDHHERLRQRGLVGDRQMNHRMRSLRRDRREPRRGAPGQLHRRLAGGKVDDAHVAPEDAVAHPRAERLGAGLLGRKSLRVGCRAAGAPIGPAPLDLGETARDETIPELAESLLDAPDIAEVAADADDHRRAPEARPSSIAARIARTVSASPTKIASPTRKWPILSSTISSRPEIVRAVS